MSIPHYKIQNYYLARPRLVCPCCKIASLIRQQLKLLFYPAVQTNASVDFEDKSVTVRIIELPNGVIGSGPTKLI